MNTYQIRYKQFPRSRRRNITTHIKATSQEAARAHIMDTIRLAQRYQRYTPFWCDHITIIDIWEVASNGKTETSLA